MDIKYKKQAASKPLKALSVGEKLVDFGQVFQITAIKQRKTEEGGAETVIFFKPYYKTDQNRDLVNLIPVNCLPLTKIRRPIQKPEMQKLIDFFAEADKAGQINTSQQKYDLLQNAPEATARVLKSLWRDKHDESTGFASVKQTLFDQAMKQMVEEVAFVFSLTPAEAKCKIERALKNGHCVSDS